MRSTVLLALAALSGAGPTMAQPDKPFAITVVDDQSGRGVPLVELKTTNQVRYYTDSNGVVAFDEPGLMNQAVFFSIQSHGYEYPADGFGYRGVRLQITPGGSAQVKVHRTNIAERLYRVTGEGIYRDSLLVGRAVPTRQPVLNGLVMGQDTVEVTPYRGKLYWFWGDTDRPSYPLGQFATSGATSLLPGHGGLDPNAGIDLTYFVDPDGFSKKMIPLPGPGPVWIGGLLTVPDHTGRERLITHYSHQKSLAETTAHGLAVFNDETSQFEPLVPLDLKAPLFPDGHPMPVTSGGVRYFYCQPRSQEAFPCVRIRADWDHVIDPRTYEGFTCLTPGSRDDAEGAHLDRAPDGRLRWGWKADTAPLSAERQRRLISAGKMKPDEALWPVQDVETGAPIQTHGGSVFWNAYRHRWVMIFGQSGGTTSLLGELWYAEADTPVGPWVYARKIVTHDRYTFYNPTQHPFFDQDGGRLLYFEGTYTDAFSGNPVPTPRYNYNQIMYRLALDDPRLSLPVPVYRVRGADGTVRFALREGLTTSRDWQNVQDIPFFAVPPSRAHVGLIPIYATPVRPPAGARVVLQSRPPTGVASPKPQFYALPANSKDAKTPSPILMPLPLDEGTPTKAGTLEPSCLVWRSPFPAPILDREAQPTQMPGS